jgi:putative nucleotidyltransferase with HDIG domain
MLKRINQVISALTARLYEADIDFIEKHLNQREQTLFWAMNLPDQRHSLNVAYTSMVLAQKIAYVDEKNLIKASLLHDVGKVHGDVSTFDKIVTVIAYKFAPIWSEKWAKFGKGNRLDNLRHAFYIYFNHAERSKEKLIAIGLDELADIVSKHHKAPASDDQLELTILRKADDVN